MKQNAILASVVLCLLAVACAQPTIDATSDESFKQSKEQIRKALAEDDRERFDEAFGLILFNGMTSDELAKNILAGEFEDPKIDLNGKTGQEILALADEIRRKQEARRREQALQEITELEQRAILAREAETELAKFKVLRSRFFKRSRGKYLDPESVIELTVENGTDQPVSRAFFIGTLASPGRSIPWIKDSFNYQIAGGLEPGEKTTWHLAPNMFSGWGKVDAPTDAVLTVDLVRLDGVGDVTLFDATGLDENEKERLESLKAQYLVG